MAEYRVGKEGPAEEHSPCRIRHPALDKTPQKKDIERWKEVYPTLSFQIKRGKDDTFQMVDTEM